MPILRPYESQTQVNGTLNVRADESSFGGSAARALGGAGQQLSNSANIIDQVDDAKSRIRSAAALSQMDLNWRQQMIERQNDPEFAKKYGEDGSRFADAFKTDFETFAAQTISSADARDRKYIEQGMYNLGESLMGDAMSYQAEVGQAFAIDTIKQGIDNARGSANLSPGQFTSIMANTDMVIDGAAHLDATKRRQLKQIALEEVTVGAALGSIEKGGAQAIINNTMTFTQIGPDGKPVTRTLRDILSEDTYDVLKNQSETYVKKLEAEAKEAIENKISDIDTAIAVAETPADFAAIQKALTDNAKLFSHKQNNAFKVDLYKAQKKINDDLGDQELGNMFGSGQAYLNPENSKNLKAYNSWYENVEAPKLQALDQDARNTRKVNIIDNAKVIPDYIKGDIKIAARSHDIDTITAAADFVDRLATKNPHMLQDFDQKDLARINMVRSQVAAGVEKSEALKRVDDALSPDNAIVYENRIATLKDEKIKYRDKALGLFDGWFTRAPDVTSNDVVSRQAIQVESDYRNAYETQFKLTGDKAEAERYAAGVVRGRYSTTTINGKKQLMRDAPEKYYGLPNDDNQWMRDQFVAEAKARLSGSMTEGATVDDVMLVPDPAYTPRTAAMGKPGYRMMMKRSDGAFVNLLGPKELFYFDPTPYKESKIFEARQRQANDPLDQIPQGAGIK